MMKDKKAKRNAPCTQLDSLRSEIQQLYTAGGLTVKQIQELINQKYGLDASYFQYRERLSKWGCRKNLTRDHLIAAKSQLANRQSKRSQATITWNKIDSIPMVVPQKRLERSIRRMDQSIPLLEKLKSIYESTRPSFSAKELATVNVAAGDMWESTIIVSTPDSGPDMRIQIASPSRNRIYRLPIFQVAEDLSRLCDSILGRRKAPGAQDISTVQTHPYFTVLRLIIWQASNRMIDYKALDQLLNKVQELECWDALFALFRIRHYSISTAARMVITILYYRNETSAALRIYMSLDDPKPSFYSFLRLGSDIDFQGDHQSPVLLEKQRRYYRSILRDIIKLGAVPSDEVEAYLGLVACRDSGTSMAMLLRSWESSTVTVYEIEAYLLRCKHSTVLWTILGTLYVHKFPRPLINSSPSDIEFLLNIGFRDGLWFCYLKSILEDNPDVALTCVQFLDIDSSFKSEISQRISKRESRQQIWEVVGRKHFLETLRRKADEICIALFPEPQKRHIEIGTLSDGWTYPSGQWDRSYENVALLIYHATPYCPNSEFLMDTLLSIQEQEFLGEDLTGVLQMAYTIHARHDPSENGNFVAERIEFLLLAARKSTINPAIHATNRMWEYATYLNSGYQQKPADTCMLAMLAKYGADFDAKTTTNRPLLNPMSEYLVDLALLRHDPSLFIFVWGRSTSFEHLNKAYVTFGGRPRALNQAFTSAIEDGDIIGVENLWADRFISVLPSPDIDEMTVALELFDAGSHELRQLAIRYLDRNPHPIVKLLPPTSDDPYDRRTRKVTSEVGHKCLEVLLWIIAAFFDQAPENETVRSCPSASIKLLHRKAAQVSLDVDAHQDFLPRFLQYGHQAESLEFDDKFGPEKWETEVYTTYKDKTFLNISRDWITRVGPRNVERLRFILEAGYDIQSVSNRQSLLTSAIHHGNMNVVTYLLEKGADIMTSYNWNNNAVQYAVILGRIDMVALFLDTDPRCQADALESAIRHKEYAIERLVREWKPDLSTTVSSENSDVASTQVNMPKTQSDSSEEMQGILKADALHGQTGVVATGTPYLEIAQKGAVSTSRTEEPISSMGDHIGPLFKGIQVPTTSEQLDEEVTVPVQTRAQGNTEDNNEGDGYDLAWLVEEPSPEWPSRVSEIFDFDWDHGDETGD